MTSHFIVKTQAELAALWGVTHGTIKEWARNGMPGKSGAYDFAAIARWRLARSERPASTDVAEQKKRMEVEKLTEEIIRLKRQESEAVGELLDRRTVEVQITLLLRSVQQSLLRLPSQLRPYLPEEAAGPALAELDRLLRLALEETERKMVRSVALAEQIKALITKILDQVEEKQQAEGAAA